MALRLLLAAIAMTSKTKRPNVPLKTEARLAPLEGLIPYTLLMGVDKLLSCRFKFSDLPR